MKHIKKDLANEITKEKNQKSTIETDTIKVRKELEELRKQLSDFKQTEADSIRKLRNKYETEIDELDLIIEKAKKDKGSNQKSGKKLERSSRETQRKLETLEKENQSLKEKENALTKEKAKTDDEIKKIIKKIK